MSVPNNQKVDTERLLVEVTLVHLPSYQQPDDQVQVPYTKPKMMLSHVMTFDATLHGVLLWASMGLIMPVGILLIRMSGRVGGNCGTRIKLLFYVHLVLQILSVLLVTAGAVLSLKSFENSFNNTHQRIGVSLYGAIWVQTCFGFFRPRQGSSKSRGLWYLVHWILGTTITIVGIINIYTGLQAYENRTSRGMRLWTILFTIEISFLAFLYLFQDKYYRDYYLQKQQAVIVEDDNI